MAYDAATKSAVLFGGFWDVTEPGAAGLETVFNDNTWLWNGSDWAEAHPATTPPEGEPLAMAYDAATQTVVLLDGSTWLWNGTTWSQASPAQSPPNGQACEDISMAYDPASKEVVLFDCETTWLWDGTNWTQATQVIPIEDATMAYSPTMGSVILFGGILFGVENGNPFSSNSGQTWAWTGSQWAALTLASSPPGGADAVSATDPTTGGIMVFGGTGSGDTWVLAGASLPGSAIPGIQTTTLPSGKVGEAYSASVTAVGGKPPYSWSISSGDLPSGLVLDPATGVIAGTPTSAGTNTFTVQVTDSSTTPQSAAATLSITIGTGYLPTTETLNTTIPLVVAIQNPGPFATSGPGYLLFTQSDVSAIESAIEHSLTATQVLGPPVVGWVEGTDASSALVPDLIAAIGSAAGFDISSLSNITNGEANLFTEMAQEMTDTAGQPAYIVPPGGSLALIFPSVEVPSPEQVSVSLANIPYYFGVCAGPYFCGTDPYNEFVADPTSFGGFTPSTFSATASVDLASGQGATARLAGSPAGVSSVVMYTGTAEDNTEATISGTSSNNVNATSTSASGSVAVSATGSGTVVVGQYQGDPTNGPGLEVGGDIFGAPSYFDVAVSQNNTFSSVTITACLQGGDTLSWDDPTGGWFGGPGWEPISGTSSSGSNPSCLTFTATPTTTPDIAELTGTVFGVGTIPTRLTLTGADAGDYHDPTTLQATLDNTSASPPFPLAGQPITLSLAGQTCTVTTNTYGQGVCSVTPDETAGNYSLTVTFAGGGGYGPAQAAGTFTVNREETTVDYTGPTTISDGSTAVLSGLLREDGLTGIAGRHVSLTLGSGATSQSCTGVSNELGAVSCAVYGVSQPLGPVALSVAFAGDGNYLPSSAGASALVYAFPAKGAFVIGDGNAAVGSTVTFWTYVWPQDNTLTYGVAPASFKGFAQTTAEPPIPGSTWSTNSGNSAEPPGTVPAYMGVIVASRVTKAGAKTSGNVVAVAVVETRSGYGPAPGKQGLGTVVALVSP